MKLLEQAHQACRRAWCDGATATANALCLTSGSRSCLGDTPYATAQSRYTAKSSPSGGGPTAATQAATSSVVAPRRVSSESCFRRAAGSHT
jgi:hypothetical protein